MASLAIVRQRAGWDCGVACLATVAGRSYEDVASLFDVEKISAGGIGGLTHYSILEGLRHLGLIGDLIFQVDQMRWLQRVPWPPDPMPKLAIVCMAINRRAHYVVWDDGAVLCPAGVVHELRDVQNIVEVLRR
ncbi:MAG TPA: cysteine peptidase family C39 domain-containing protein [Planctomycetota bacterium]|nr:cysteine peptidase family C39 domain-containing protein [Planctomycetota bacterium]